MDKKQLKELTDKDLLDEANKKWNPIRLLMQH